MTGQTINESKMTLLQLTPLTLKSIPFVAAQASARKSAGWRFGATVFLAIVFIASYGLAVEAQSLRPMVFAVSSTDVSASPIFVAQHLGYFKEDGLDAKIVIMRSDIAMKGLVTGDVDFASSISSVVKAAAIGAPVKVVLNFFNGSFFYLVAKPPIANVQELKGKVLAVSRFGSATDFDARAALRHFGMDPNRDVKILAVGGGSTRIAALLSGRVDAAIVNNIEKGPAAKSGMKVILFTGQYVKQPVGGLGTSTRHIVEKRDDVRKSVKAVYRALLAMRTERDKVKPAFEKDLAVKADQFDDIYGDAMKVFLPTGKIDLQDLAGPYDDARKAATNPPPVSLTDLVDYSVLDEIRKTIR